jgi:hypothetical protein
MIGMRTVAGAILILAGEQAFSHAHLIPFPHQVYAQMILLPFAAVSTLTGIGFVILGWLSERKPT